MGQPVAPRLRLGVLLWLFGMPGVVLVSVTMLPQLLRQAPLPAPVGVVIAASIAQSAALVALAVWAGVSLAPRIGFRAPAFEALAAGYPVGPALRPQLLPGLAAGAASGVLLFMVSQLAPAAITRAQESFEAPLPARVLYGGVTEELLLRWGLMSAVVWLLWRFVQQRQGLPRASLVWVGIVLSALAFGAGHLPAAAALAGGLSIPTVIYVVGANTVFGIVFGYLFRRWGLEAAMLAHASAHVVDFVASLA
jgi:hypothetical protein